MDSPSNQDLSGHQHAHLLELEERQREIKRLCEEALREEEQHDQLFQHLENHSTGAASSVGSLAGGAGSVGGAAGLHVRPVSPRAEAETLDDLLTGEVQSFRDPNSIARASSAGSAAAVPWPRGLSSLNPRNASLDRPYTRLGSSYRPPTYPLPTLSAAQPPPPPRAMLYGTSRYPREEGNRAAAATTNRSIHPPTLPPPTSSPLRVSDTWWRGEEGAAERRSRSYFTAATCKASDRVGASCGVHAAVAAFSAHAAHAPLSPPPPPPPPERSRSRSASYSIPLADPCRRSGAPPHYSVPPPPPPASYATQATVSPFSALYSRARSARTGLSPPIHASSPPPPLPSRSSAPPLVSPDEATDDLPPPPPRTHRLAAASRDVKLTIASMYRRPRNFLNLGPSLPPPPPSGAYTDLDDSSILSTTSTHDIARWGRRLSGVDALEKRDGHSAGSGHDRSKSAAQQPFSTRLGTKIDATLAEWCVPSASAAPRLSVPYRETATRRGVEVVSRAPRSSPPPPPPPPPPPTASGVGLFSSLARFSEGADEGESLPNRWETASLTPSLRSAEERRLRSYFAKPDGVVRSSAAVRKSYTSYSRQRVPASHNGVESAQATLLAADSMAHFTSAPAAARFKGSASAWQRTSGTGELPLQQPSAAIPPPTPLASSAPTATGAPPPAPAKSKPKTTALHPYGPAQAQSTSLSPPPERGLRNAAARSGCDAPAPPSSALYAKHQQTIPSDPNGSRRSSTWGSSGAAAAPAPHTSVAASANDYFDMGPEKEALLSLLQESTRHAPGRSVGPALPTTSHESSIPPGATSAVLANMTGGDQHDENGHPYPPSASHVFARNQAQNFDTPPMMTTLPPHYDDPAKQHSYFNWSAGTSVRRGGGVKAATGGVRHENEVTAAQLQQKCDEAQSKAEALARHLVKAINDRKMLQENVEQLEVLVEECNAEVGRLQQIVEEQHQDSVTSLGVQAALRAKEREVAVYEEEIRRLNVVLNGHLTRKAAAERVAQENVHHGMVVMGAEVEEAMTEVGMAHLAQLEAEERASQLASELNTAVEQIQFLDERLAEMERAAAAARFERMPARISEEHSADLANSNAAATHLSAAAHFGMPPDEETRHWPPEARRAIAQLIAQAEGLLLQNAEGERHASMRLQHMESTCSELQRHLRQRGEEAERVREACAQLRQEKSALQAVGNLWYQQLREVKEDAQLVSEMVRTAREDAEDVYLSSRVAEECAAAHRAAAVAASPLQPLPTPAPTNPETLKKASQFAQQVMRDFHAVSRFLSSLRTMNIGDQNGYQILQAIASGRTPAEGLYATSDDAATPKRLRELLSPNAASEAKRRVQEKKARVLRAVEQALIIDPVSTTAPPLPTSPDRPDGRPSRQGAIMLGLPPRVRERPPPAASEEYEVPDALEDELVNDDEAEVEVVSSSLHPVRMGSQVLRDGSSGMVHSDVRQRPASDSVTALSHSRVPPTASTSEGSRAPPALAASLSPVPFALDRRSSCNTLFMEGSEAPITASASRPTAAKAAPVPLTPVPSVSRPLRLSATPSQPQSEGREDEEEVVVPSDKQPSPTPASLHPVLTADSMYIGGHVAGADADMSSVTLVSSPSMLQQTSQQQPAMAHQAPPPSSMLAVTATPPLDHVAEVNCRTIPSIPSLSGIAMADHNEGASAAHHIVSVPLQVQAQQQDNSMPAAERSIVPLPSRLRSPTPEQLPAVWTEMRADVTLLTTPLHRPRPSQSFADEPPPRVVRDENSQPVHLGSQPKDRSTTARPPSTPHPDSLSGTRRGGEAGSVEEIVAPPLRTGRHRSSASNESNDDEATLFFREPPRGEVQEVAAERTQVPMQPQHHTPVEVSLISDEFSTPSRSASAAAVPLGLAPGVHPKHTSVLDQEADVEGRVPSAVPAGIRASPHPELPLKGSHTAASPAPVVAPMSLEDSTAKKQSSSRGHRVVDDDDEPSLSFSAPQALPSSPKEHAKGGSESDALACTLSTEAPLRTTGQTRTIENTGGAADPTEHAPHSSLFSSRDFAGPPLRALHQPRRSVASPGCPGLTAVADTVAPPRLQRSAGSSQWTEAQPYRGIATPEPEVTAGAAAGLGQHSRGGSQSLAASLSLNHPLSAVTPALVEPRRPSPSARPVPAAAHTSSVTPGNPFSSTATTTEGPLTAQEQTSTVHEKAEASQAQSEVVRHVDDPLRSDGKLSANIPSSAPESRLPSIASTAAPSSPLRVLEELSGALNLPDEMRSNTLAHGDNVVSILVERLQAPPGHSRELSARTGSSAVPRRSPNEGAEPAPLPTANVDAPESNTLDLRRASQRPSPPIAEAATPDGNRSSSSPAAAQAPASTISTPRSGSAGRDGPANVWSSIPMEQSMSDEAAARRREDVARILKRIKMKNEQGRKACSEMGTPTSPTASELSSARLEDMESP
ncbi:hypothetical protein CUR178_01392 [Leishmania enriettii]|uniref:Uncharacterized protein n=1 Tax=Leishmania enriettii TaxID=5663 RepID=A0A836KF65_LEIEN|nr:hypothetical protein CUR178_01392 [Leishmania enriettii]